MPFELENDMICVECCVFMCVCCVCGAAYYTFPLIYFPVDLVTDPRLSAPANLRNRFIQILDAAFPSVFQLLHQFMVLPTTTLLQQKKVSAIIGLISITM